MVVSVDTIRNEYDRTEDQIYKLRCSYGYNSTFSRVFRKLEAEARRLNKILRHMENVWGLR